MTSLPADRYIERANAMLGPPGNITNLANFLATIEPLEKLAEGRKFKLGDGVTYNGDPHIVSGYIMDGGYYIHAPGMCGFGVPESELSDPIPADLIAAREAYKAREYRVYSDAATDAGHADGTPFIIGYRKGAGWAACLAHQKEQG